MLVSKLCQKIYLHSHSFDPLTTEACLLGHIYFEKAHVCKFLSDTCTFVFVNGYTFTH